MTQHIFEENTDPLSVPVTLGAHWINTVTKLHWFSVGTSSVGDWQGPYASLGKAFDFYEEAGVVLTAEHFGGTLQVGADGGEVTINCDGLGAARAGTSVSFVLVDSCTVSFDTPLNGIVLRKSIPQQMTAVYGTAQLVCFGEVSGEPLWVLSVFA